MATHDGLEYTRRERGLNGKRALQRPRAIVSYLLTIDYSKEEIIEVLINRYNRTQKQAEQDYKDGIKHLNNKVEKWDTKTAERNYKRLDCIIDEAMESGNVKNALAAIDQQNKLAGAYEKKVLVKTEGETPFKVKIES